MELETAGAIIAGIMPLQQEGADTIKIILNSLVRREGSSALDPSVIVDADSSVASEVRSILRENALVARERPGDVNNPSRALFFISLQDNHHILETLNLGNEVEEAKGNAPETGGVLDKLIRGSYGPVGKRNKGPSL